MRTAAAALSAPTLCSTWSPQLDIQKSNALNNLTLKGPRGSMYGLYTQYLQALPSLLYIHGLEA